MRRIVKTESGSEYEIDTDLQTIRRISGGAHFSGLDTPARYTALNGPTVGSGMRIELPYGRHDDRHGDRCTWVTTSKVTDIS
jgi:hypothetical protein